MRNKKHSQLTLFGLCAIALLSGLAFLVANGQSSRGIKYAVRLDPADSGWFEVYVDARRMAINEQIEAVTGEVAFYDDANRLIKTQRFSFLDGTLRKLTPTEETKRFKHTCPNARSAVPVSFVVRGFARGGSGKSDSGPGPVLAAAEVSDFPARPRPEVVVGPPPASIRRAPAAIDLDPEKSYFIMSVSSGKLMDVKDGSEEDWTPIIQTARQEGAPQQWRFEPLHGADEGYYFIHSARSNKCLDVRLGDTSDGTAIIQYTCNGGDCQKWAVIPVADSAFQLVAKHSGKAVDVSGAVLEDVALIQYGRHQGTNQQWRLTPDR